MSRASAAKRTEALEAIAGEVERRKADILAANETDLVAAGKSGLTAAMLDRLRLTPERVDGCARAVRDVAGQEDLVGRVVEQRTRPNGLEISKVRIPLGVVCMIYESRPNVTTDAAALCIRSGNAVILRGGSEAFHSNQALGAAVSAGLEKAALPAHTVSLVPTTDRKLIRELLACEEYIDVVIPRGGEGLIRHVSEHSRIPVLKHDRGVCHVYVHASADIDTALNVCVNAKASRPSVCNAAEAILIDAGIADAFVPKLVERLRDAGVEMLGDEACVALGCSYVKPASPDDWGREFLAKKVFLRKVDNLTAATDHIAQYGSNHSEAILTTDPSAADQFVNEVNSSTVLVNASTRFADGGELGLGAEIGISTTKLHAYGPMGAEGLTTTKFVVRGQGHVRT